MMREYSNDDAKSMYNPLTFTLEVKVDICVAGTF